MTSPRILAVVSPAEMLASRIAERAMRRAARKLWAAIPAAEKNARHDGWHVVRHLRETVASLDDMAESLSIEREDWTT